ncbi:hypothetical protein QGN29_03090 [Temperatibacter marinus]|uniref:Uncharacterized protein n=1 Tax=Temperatibacter marinus TaxID=1456591 RepID=A0AA52EID5_9PROT|nr:hypothetical protein [Temperatibacter marinus]WND03355.1 hypothetical protein QGN29_03090 [Temperatibacter marinus]
MKNIIPEENSPKNKSAWQSVRLVTSLIFVSITVYYAFRIFICDGGSLACKSLYEWEEIFAAIAIVLVAIIGAAALTAILYKVLRYKKSKGMDWASSSSDREE